MITAAKAKQITNKNRKIKGMSTECKFALGVIEKEIKAEAANGESWTVVDLVDLFDYNAIDTMGFDEIPDDNVLYEIKANLKKNGFTFEENYHGDKNSWVIKW